MHQVYGLYQRVYPPFHVQGPIPTRVIEEL